MHHGDKYVSRGISSSRSEEILLENRKYLARQCLVPS